MNDAFNSSFSLGNPLFSQLGLDGQVSDAKTIEEGLLLMVTDTISSTQTGDGTTVSTGPISSKPRLDKPGAVSGNINGLRAVSGAAKKFNDQFNSFIKQFVNNHSQDQQQEQSPDFLNEVQKQLSQLPEQQLAQLGNKPPEELEAMVMYAIINPKADLPAPVKALAAQITAQVQKDTGQKLSTLDRNSFNQTIDEGYDVFFQQALQNSGLPAEEQNKVSFAHTAPQYAESLPANLKAALQQCEKASMTKLQKELGIPASWTPPNNSKNFESELGLTFQRNVENQLMNMQTDGKINQQQYNELRTLFFNPGANTPHAASLLPILKQVTNEQLNNMQKTVGFPDGYAPPIIDTSRNNMLTGAFYQTAVQSIKNQNPPLSDNDQKALITALSSPRARLQLSPALKSALQNIELEATSDVKKTYALPDTWVPSAKALITIGSNTSPLQSLFHQIVNNALDQAQERVDIANKIIDSPAVQAALPADVGNVYKNFLKAVGMALNRFREANYTASVKDGQVAHILNQIQNEAKMGQLEKQHKALKEVAEKMAKMATMGPIIMALVMVLLFFLMAVLIVVTMGAMAPAMAATAAVVEGAIASGTEAAVAGAAAGGIAAGVEASTAGAVAAAAGATEAIGTTAVTAATSQGVMATVTSLATAAFNAAMEAGATVAAATEAATVAVSTAVTTAIDAAVETATVAVTTALETAAETLGMTGAEVAATDVASTVTADALATAAPEIGAAASAAAASPETAALAATAGETAAASFTVSTTTGYAIITASVTGFIMTGLSMDTGHGSGLSTFLKSCGASKKVIEGFTMAMQMFGMVLMLGADIGAMVSIPAGAMTAAATRAMSDVGKKVLEWAAEKFGSTIGPEATAKLMEKASALGQASNESTQKIGTLALHSEKLKVAETAAKENFKKIGTEMSEEATKKSANVNQRAVDKFVRELQENAQQVTNLKAEREFLESKPANSLTKGDKAKLQSLIGKNGAKGDIEKAEVALKEFMEENKALITKCGKKPNDLQGQALDICKPTSGPYVALEYATKEMTSTIEYLSSAGDAATQIIQSIPKMRNSVLEAQIARIKGDMESDQVLIDQLVKAFKALIDKLLNGLKGFTSVISDINHTQQKMYQEASSAVGGLIETFRG